LLDLDQLQTWTESEGMAFDQTECLIWITKVGPNQMSHVRRLLAPPNLKRMKANVVILTSDEEVDINNTQQLVIMINFKKTCCPKITSLCPTVGKKYSEKHDGLCPRSSNNLLGKSIKISYIGISPYILYMNETPPRGSDIHILNLLAQKFQFKVQYFRFVNESKIITQSVYVIIICRLPVSFFIL
jgi:hypothetical protein